MSRWRLSAILSNVPGFGSYTKRFIADVCYEHRACLHTAPCAKTETVEMDKERSRGDNESGGTSTDFTAPPKVGSFRQ